MILRLHQEVHDEVNVNIVIHIQLPPIIFHLNSPQDFLGLGSILRSLGFLFLLSISALGHSAIWTLIIVFDGNRPLWKLASVVALEHFVRLLLKWCHFISLLLNCLLISEHCIIKHSNMLVGLSFDSAQKAMTIKCNFSSTVRLRQ